MQPITQPRHPLIGIAALFIVGIGAGLKTIDFGWSFAAIAIGCGVAATVIYWRSQSPRWKWATTATTVFCAGLLAGAVSQQTCRDEHAWLTAHAGERVVVRGVVDRNPKRGHTKKSSRPPNIPLRRIVIEHAGDAYALDQTPTWVRWYGSQQPPQIGEAWTFNTRLPRLYTRARTPFLPVNSRPDDAVLLAPPVFWDWRPLADQARKSAAHRLMLGIKSWPIAPVLIRAMLLGTRNEIPREVNNLFRDSGTIHVFAISGLGIGLVAAVLATGLALLAVPRQRWGIVLIPLLTAYTLLTGASPSAMRACLMAAFYFGAPLLERKPDGPSALAAAAILQLAWQPRHLFSASFLLSYTAMAGLILLFPPFSRLCKRALGVESAARQAALLRLSQRLMPQQTLSARHGWALRTAVWSYQIRIWLANMLAMSLAAWSASIPLTAYYFGRFTPGGLLANLVVVPTAFLVTVTAAISILVSFVSTFAAEAFNNTAATCASLMMAASRLTVSIPGATFRVPAPPLTLVVAWYLAMFVVAWRLQAVGKSR